MPFTIEFHFRRAGHVISQKQSAQSRLPKGISSGLRPLEYLRLTPESFDRFAERVCWSNGIMGRDDNSRVRAQLYTLFCMSFVVDDEFDEQRACRVRASDSGLSRI